MLTSTCLRGKMVVAQQDKGRHDMTQPMDPNNLDNPGNSEYSWGQGIFPPGIANNEGQTKRQDDFGANLPGAIHNWGDKNDNYARAVADRRTDACDPASNRDFETYGNCDRYGPNPALVIMPPEPNVPQYHEVELNQTPRRK